MQFIIFLKDAEWSLSIVQQNKGGEEGKGVGYIGRLEIGMEDTFLTIPVILSFDTTLDTDMGILGQVGLFDNFIVQFDRANKTVVLK